MGEEQLQLNGANDYTIRSWEDAGAFLDRAEAWLLLHEAEHNLILGIARQLENGTALFQHPVYLATVESNGAIAGCAFRTPPYKLGVTRMPAEAVPALVTDIANFYRHVPAVIGDADVARTFAELWTHRYGGTARAGMKQRIYQLDTVTPPARMPNGAARLATQKDAGVVADWLGGFSVEAAIHTDNPQGVALARIRQSSLYLWEDNGVPVAMAAWSGDTPNGRRVGPVYTPRAHRQHGYATALVAHVSQRILEDGFSFCFLYTDLGNPTSNSIYQHVGYRPVCDVMDWIIDDQEPQ